MENIDIFDYIKIKIPKFIKQNAKKTCWEVRECVFATYLIKSKCS